ncbi:SDR family oxidoreductase [Pseudomonas sp. MPFS]|uniref:SDR family NAD(P)-dependent oxidoreductase n=1 Tax=Pseudomonas sp. MPFS TaxID=2795724 RepID=UPI001F12A795|nr:SDR family NAD(P)-dependent oxidoreductase [Pseudomonas sp. MPFS]UMZ14049.1 SDR family oxidoreductase [Pseudomonas sp. MPFS]
MKVALVTGGTRGIGFSIVNLLALEEYLVVITCGTKSHSESKLPEGVEYIQCDISNSNSVSSMINKIIERHHSIDILINNAGVSHIKSDGRFLIEDIQDDIWHQVINTNLSGAFYTCKQVIPHMKKNHYGRIINISSASARFGGVLASVDYIASKSGLIGLTKGLAYELRSCGITVNAIAPGRIDTDMICNANLSADWAKNHVPLGRLGKGEDIAGVVLFLISKHADYVHGATLDCNGGWVIT